MGKDKLSPQSAKELFANLIVSNAKSFANENLTKEEVLELLKEDEAFKLMFKLCIEFSSHINEIAEIKVKELNQNNADLLRSNASVHRQNAEKGVKIKCLTDSLQALIDNNCIKGVGTIQTVKELLTSIKNQV